MTETNTIQHEGLAQLLESRLIAWEKARMPQEQKMLECYQDVMRIPRDEDTKGTGAARSTKAKSVFLGSTRNKVRSARAKIVDALFGNGKMPFDTTPTKEELAPFADVVEDIVTEQLKRMDFKSLMRAGVNTLATYGTGFIFGVFVRKECIYETNAETEKGLTKLQDTKYEFDFPYFELANTLDVYPDSEAKCVKDSLGFFWATMESKQTVEAWKEDKSYKNIDQTLINLGDRGNETGGERAAQLRANVDFWHKNDRIKVARFFGKIPKNKINPTDDNADSGEMIDAIVIMAGGVVVKVNEMPYKKGAVYRCAYEEVDNEMWAVGVAENNAPHQKISNAAFRLFLEGKGMALLGTKSVDRSMFAVTEDFVKHPGKVYNFKPNLTPEERKSAIIEHIEPDITGGWIDLIRMSDQFSDDDTAITKYTQGDDSSNLNKTASGISMIMNASSLPTKEVISNIDSHWIEPIVEALIEWNIKYLEVETVAKIHGDEHAQTWAQIKEFGKTSFMDWQATGTSTFMQKESLTNKLRAFAEFALSNPNTAPLIDGRELLNQTWEFMGIGKESPILKEEDGGAPQTMPPEAQQAMQNASDHIKQQDEQLNQANVEIQKLQEKIATMQNGDAEKKTASEQSKQQLEMLKIAAQVAPKQVAALIRQQFGIEFLDETMTDEPIYNGNEKIEEEQEVATNNAVLATLNVLIDKIDTQNRLETVIMYDDMGRAVKSVKRLPEEENMQETQLENGIEE
jgi:hypothetical protein